MAHFLHYLWNPYITNIQLADAYQWYYMVEPRKWQSIDDSDYNDDTQSGWSSTGFFPLIFLANQDDLNQKCIAAISQ